MCLPKKPMLKEVAVPAAKSAKAGEVSNHFVVYNTLY
jgi:hypothetical protein